MRLDLKENIFLLEIIVDRLQINSSCGAECNVMNGSTVVEFYFLKHGPLSISSCNKEQERTGVKNGSSCLFSMTPINIKKARNNFDLIVHVFKQFCNIKINIANQRYSLSGLFTQLLLDADRIGVPCAKTTKEYFNLMVGEIRGNLSFFVRLSCFGEIIINKFQMDVQSHYKTNDQDCCSCDKKSNYSSSKSCTCFEKIRNAKNIVSVQALNSSSSASKCNCENGDEFDLLDDISYRCCLCDEEEPLSDPCSCCSCAIDEDDQNDEPCPCCSCELVSKGRTKKKKKKKKKSKPSSSKSGSGGGCVWIDRLDRCPPPPPPCTPCYQPYKSSCFPAVPCMSYHCNPCPQKSFYSNNYC